MPRLNKFNKRKRVFCGSSDPKKSKVSETSDLIPDSPEPSCSNVRPIPESEVGLGLQKDSASMRKVGSNLDEYERFQSTNVENGCFDIVNLQNLSKLLEQIAVCVKCGGSLIVDTKNRIGLSVNIIIKCSRPSCSFEVSSKNSEKLSCGKLEVNVRTMYAFRCIGKGEEAAKTFCAVMDLPSPPSFKRYKKVVHTAAKEACEDSMKTAAEECIIENDNDRDVTAIFDGSWQRRGHTSLNGVVTAIAANIGKVIDVRIFSKFCRCKKRLQNEHDRWSCAANYQGSSGGMEVAGVVDMFYQSQTRLGLRYKYYLGDGDSAAYPTVVSESPYGPECPVEKLECLGHVKKKNG